MTQQKQLTGEHTEDHSTNGDSAQPHKLSFIASIFPGKSEDDPELLAFEAGVAVDDFRPYHQIRPRLFLGSIRAASNYNMLASEMGVSHILQVIPHTVSKFEGLFTIYQVPAFDSEDFDLKSATKNFTLTNKFIDAGVHSKGIFVHCFAGVSRSAAVVIAYLMWKEGMDYVDAAKLVKLKRRAVDLNKGFVAQLMEYDKELRKERTILSKH